MRIRLLTTVRYYRNRNPISEEKFVSVGLKAFCPGVGILITILEMGKTKKKDFPMFHGRTGNKAKDA